MNHPQPIRSSQDIGALIARARRNRGQTQRQLAADFGVSQAWISRIELGQQKAWIGQVLRLASFLGIELSARIHTEGTPTPASRTASDYPDLNDLV